MKNFNTMGVHWKIQFFGEGGGWFTKYSVANCLKSGAWIVCRFKVRGGRGGGRGEKERDGVFDGVPQCTL